MAVTAAEIRAVISAQDQLSATLSKVQGELRNLGSSATGAGNAARSAGPGWVSMSTAVAAGTIAANAFMAAARGVVGMLSSAGQASTDFGQSMANIRSIIPDEDFQRFGGQLQQTALRLGKDYPLSAAEAGKSMELLAQKGISAEKIIGGGADAVVKLASATGADLVTATGIAAAAMDTFNISAEDMDTVTNLMTGAMIRGGVSATDFGHAVQAGGAVIALAGGSIEDASIAIAAMAKAGIEGSDAGTSLKTMYMNLQPTTKAATAAMLELGLVTKDGRNAFFDAQGNVKSYEEISKILSTSLEGLTEQQRLQALETMFGSDAIRAAAISAKFGAGAYGDLGKEIRQVDAGEVAKKRMDSLAGSLKQFGGSAETVGITLVGKLGPGLKAIVDTGTELLNAFLEKLDSAEAQAFFQAVGEEAQRLGDWLYDAGQRAGEFNGAVGSALTGVAAVLRGDAKGAAEAFGDAIGQMVDGAKTALSGLEGATNTVVGVVAAGLATLTGKELDPLKTNAENAATQVRILNDQLAKINLSQDFAAATGNLGKAWQEAAALGKVFADTLNLVAGGWARHNDSVGPAASLIGAVADVFNMVVRGAALGMEAIRSWIGVIGFAGSATVASYRMIGAAMSGNMEEARQWERVAQTSWENVGKTINTFNADVTLTAIANGDKRIELTQEEYNKLYAIADEGQKKILNAHVEGQTRRTGIITQGVEADIAAFEQYLPQATRITDAAHNAINQIIGQGVAEQAATIGNGAAEAAALYEANLAPMPVAAETNAAAATAAIEAQAPAMAAAAESGASGTVAAVEAQSGPAAAAGELVGSNLGSGLASGILSWIGQVRAAAASLVNAAIGAGNVEGEIESPSKRTQKTGRALAEGVGVGIDELAPAIAEKMRALIDAAASYTPIAGEIARVEREIKEIREQSSTDALFREKEMVTIVSESLRLKQAQVALERDLIPLRQDLARATREVADIERGSLGDRTKSIELDSQRKQLRLQTLDLEQQLVGLDRDSKRAKSIQEQIDKLRDQDQLLGIEAERIRLTNEIAATGAKVRREGLDDQVRGQEAVIQRIKDQIDALGGEQAIFAANEAVIKNATENEIKYREQLIAVFKSEAKPLTDRIEAGLKLVDQLEAEGAISKELADQLRKVAKEATDGKLASAGLGAAAQAATPQLDAAARKADEMAREAADIARETANARREVEGLGNKLDSLPSLFDVDFDFSFNTRRRHGGGPVAAGLPYLVGKTGAEELFVPDRSGMILSHEATRSMLSGGDGASTPAFGSARGYGIQGGQAIHIYIGDRELLDWYVEAGETVERLGRS